MTRNEYWMALRKLRNEWETTPAIEWGNFNEYVKAVAGIEIIYVGDHIGSEYKIVDKEQYLLFKLKN
jgi:hypothetical protein